MLSNEERPSDRTTNVVLSLCTAARPEYSQPVQMYSTDKKEIRHVSGSLTVLLSPNYKTGSPHSTDKFIVDGLTCPHFDISLA